MKRLPLSAEDRQFLKAIEGDPAMVLILMYLLYPTPVNADQLTFEFKWDSRKNRAKTALEYLSSDGFTALVKGQGYVLTTPARRRIAELLAPTMMVDINAQALGGVAQALSPVSAGTLAIDENIIDVAKDESELKMSTQNARALKKEEEEEELIIKNQEESSTSDFAQNVCNDEMEIAPGVTTKRVLLASSMLEGFGEGVFLHGIETAVIHPRMALGWLAQAYTERNKLGNPAGLVYARLRDAEQPKPRNKYYENWEEYLPDEFLQAVGLLELICTACKTKFATVEDFREHDTMMMKCESCGERFHDYALLEGHEKTHKSSVACYKAMDAESRGYKAWMLVRNELESEMPKASFETWVRDVFPAAFNENILTLAVRNAYACDWLVNRLADKVNAMLRKFLNNPDVSAVFVVGVEVEE